MLGAVAAEIRKRREIHQFGYLGERQTFVIQIVFYYRYCMPVYERCDTVPGYSFNCSGEVFGRYVKPVGVKEGNKEIMIIPGASHVDLYDDVAGVIPYDKIESFFNDNLK